VRETHICRRRGQVGDQRSAVSISRVTKQMGGRERAAFRGLRDRSSRHGRSVGISGRLSDKRNLRCRAGFRALLCNPDGEIALRVNTHELAIRVLSALDLDPRTAPGHHRRRVPPAQPAEPQGERLTDTVDERTSAVLLSTVLLKTGHTAEVWTPTCARTGAKNRSSTPTTGAAGGLGRSHARAY
jgi:hypothetical protein